MSQECLCLAIQRILNLPPPASLSSSCIAHGQKSGPVTEYELPLHGDRIFSLAAAPE